MPAQLPTGVHITYSRQYRRCRKANCSRCAPDTLGHGPYWFAYWREAGRLRSCYLGKRQPPGAATAPEVVASVTSPLAVRTLGTFSVLLWGTPVPEATWRRRAPLALFTCLLGARGHRLHREQVVDTLWPELEPPAAARRLQSTLHALRTILAGPGQESNPLRHEGDMIVLEPVGTLPGPEWLDADLFSRLASVALRGEDSGICRAALALYGGDYLPDDLYSEWVVLRREELRNQYLALALHLARLSGAAGDLEGAEQYLRLVLRHDACQEDAAATLMGMLASAGRRVDALRVYQDLATALGTALGLAPSSEIELLRGRVQMQIAARLPPLGHRPDAVGNLPAPVTSFIGRIWEQGEIAQLLVSTRLVTLTGPGGCGKTRLALETTGRLHERFPDGVWLIELAAIHDPTLVAAVVAATVGTPDDRKLSGTALVAALCASLRSRHILLLLDNCEHLIGACAEITSALLRACPGLLVMATSREALGIAGETTWHVPPLATPPEDEPPFAALPGYEAVQLFVDRAHASRPDFALTPANAPAVLRICRQLDGLPLALELAAARLGTLPVESVAARLHDCFALLTGGNRTALPRQHTLKATLDWSYGLLSSDERTVLRRLSVFAGGWTLDAAVAICRDLDHDDHNDGTATQHLLDELASRSLVRIVAQDGRTRYGLLETTRQYAHDRLVESGEREEVCMRHRAWYLDQLVQAGAAARTGAGSGWLDRLERELDNLRAVVAASCEQPEGRMALLLRAEPIAHLCLVRGHLAEGRRWLLAALAEGAADTSQARALALSAAGTLASELGDYQQSMVLYEEGRALYAARGDHRGVARVLINQGNVMKYQGEPDRARALYEAGCLQARAQCDSVLLATGLNNLGTLAIELGDTALATAVLEESLALKRQSGSPSGITQVLVNLGEVARARHELPRATSRYEEALALANSLGDLLHIALLHYNLGLVASAQGEGARAAAEFRQGLRGEQELGNRRQVAANLEGLAGVAADSGRSEQAGLLLGAAEHLREQIGAPVPEADRAIHERDLARVRTALAEAGTAAVWSRGRAMALDAAIAAALTVGVDSTA